MNSNCQEIHNTISTDKGEQLHSGLQDEENLSSSEKNLDEHFEKELNHWWTIMKNSGNKRMIKRKRSWKHKVKPCDDLDGALRWYNRENLELRKEKMNTRTENYFIMNNLRKKELITWMKQE